MVQLVRICSSLAIFPSCIFVQLLYYKKDTQKVKYIPCFLMRPLRNDLHYHQQDSNIKIASHAKLAPMKSLVERGGVELIVHRNAMVTYYKLAQQFIGMWPLIL
ncbi:hypothetical protein ES703_100867 [subsurface metagenome]